MTKDGISPEEKLLRLIKNPPHTQHTQAAADNTSTFSSAPLEPAVVNLPHSEVIGKTSSFLSIKKIIVPFFTMSCIFLIISFLYPLFSIKQKMLPETSLGKRAELKTELFIEAKPYEFYAQGIGSRSIFSVISAPAEEKEQSAVNIDSEKLFGELNLIGVISGDNPQAIVEDKKTHKTYYINKGQSIGEFQAEDIQEGKVILNYNGQKFELYL